MQEVTVLKGQSGNTHFECIEQLLPCAAGDTHRIIERPNTDYVPEGDRIVVESSTQTTTVTYTYISACNEACHIGNEVAKVSLLPAHEAVVLAITVNERKDSCSYRSTHTCFEFLLNCLDGIPHCLIDAMTVGYRQ